MTDSPYTGECARVVDLLGRIGDRWTLRVAVALSPQPLRFNQLRRVVTGISQQMLTRTLRSLERDGMVRRTVIPTVPPQVEYELTALGQSFAGEGIRLGSWAADNLVEIARMREAFDQRDQPSAKLEHARET